MASSSGGLCMSTPTPGREVGRSTWQRNNRNRRSRRNKQQHYRNLLRRGAPPAAPFNSTGYLMALRAHLREREAEHLFMFDQYGSNVQQFPARWPFGLQVRSPHSAEGRVLYDPAVHVGVGYYHDLYENDADG